MPEHLLLPERIPLESRRQGRVGGPVGQPRNPREHGSRLKQGLDRAIERARPIRVVEEVDPALVFKVRATGRITDQTWAARDLDFLGETEEWTYFVLSREGLPERLVDQLATYSSGPDELGARAPNYTFFELLDEIEPYGPEDRRGPGIPQNPGTLAEPIVVDALAWPSQSREEAERRLGEMQSLAQRFGSTIISWDGRARFTVLRARVSGEALEALLQLSVVERIRTPPTPYLEPSDWLDARIEDLAVDREEGEPIGVIDDGIADHPLLDGLVASRRAFPPEHRWGPMSSHGTMVAGLALFGELEPALRDGRPLRAHGTVHEARVLEPDPSVPQTTSFAPGITTHQAVERAIETLHSEEGVRIFNLSIADRDAYSGPHVGVLTQRLDELIRELGIVVTVSAGNHPVNLADATMDSGHPAEEGYPEYALHARARVAEPAPAALALSVGSLARFDAPQTLGGEARVGDHAIASIDELSPFSRSGPGAFKGVKPDFVEYGGNWVINDAGVLETQNPGVSVASLGVNEAGRLFSVATGTSFAAPRVARLAADVWAAYPDASANLVRALIAIACRVPESAQRQFQDDTDRMRATGYGRPIGDLAIESGARRVVMVFDGEMPTDTASIHPIPVPEVFSRGRRSRRMGVALAFDPPVRRQRREYLAGQMTFDLLRNVEAEEIRERYARQAEQRVDLWGDRHRIKLEPGVQATQNSTLQLRHFSPQWLQPDDGDVYYLALTHRSAQWAEEGDQRYAIAVELVEEEEVEIDLHAAVQQQVRVPARVRVRG